MFIAKGFVRNGAQLLSTDYPGWCMVSDLLSQHFRSGEVEYPSAKCVSKTVEIRITVAVFFLREFTKISLKSTPKLHAPEFSQ